MASWSADPWNLFTGTYQGKPIYFTRDEADRNNVKVKPFPAWDYLRPMTKEIITVGTADVEESTLAIWKSRRTYVSYIVCGISLWECLFVPATNWIISKVRQDDAEDLMRDKIQFTYEGFPDWFKQSYPVKFTDKKYRFLKTTSYIQAAAQNFDSTAARGQGGSVFVDEACFMENLKQSYEACVPMAQRIILASTPGVTGTNSESNEFFRALCEGEEYETEPEGPVIDASGGLNA